jgi:hypothetical protein
MPSGYLRIEDLNLVADNEGKYHFLYHFSPLSGDNNTEQIIHLTIDGASNELVRTAELPENAYQFAPTTIDIADNNMLYGFFYYNTTNDAVFYSVDEENKYIGRSFKIDGQPSEKSSFHVLNKKVSLMLEDNDQLIHIYHFDTSVLD